MDNRSIKLTFIRLAQERYMQEVIRDMQREIARTKSVDSGGLKDSLRYTSISNPVTGTGQSELYFSKHGRFLDMGVGKSYPLGGPSTTSSFAHKAKKRTPKKIYSKIVYGRLNSLISELSYGFTDEIKQEILSLNQEQS